MKITIKCIIAACAVLIMAGPKVAGQYRDHATMTRDMYNLAKANPSLCEIKSLVKTETGKDIYVLTIGTGDKGKKPGIAVLGGVEGSYILGREIAAGFAENILKNASSPEIKDLLTKVTFYVMPDVSPDASEQYFSPLRYERNWNAGKVDLDRDFVTNEDPFEDLNKDGFITLIRVHDPDGTHAESAEDPRIMVAVDISRGEKGKYFIYSEGIDNDGDGAFNEDGEGGVNFNNNWTYNYQEFGRYAGRHPVSEPEVKAIADFLFDQWNVFAVFTFGPQDNLTQTGRAASPQTGGAQTGPAQAPAQQAGAFTGRGGAAGAGAGATAAAAGSSTSAYLTTQTLSVSRTDETVNRLVSEKYIAKTGTRGSAPNVSARGNFSEWAYFHYGRFSYSTPGWWPAIDRGRNTEAAFLKYAEDNKLGDVFVPWTEIKHPGFPDKKVEVGGIKPFAMIVPPADKVQGIVTANYEFLKDIAALHPHLEIKDFLVENIGGDIYRVTLKLHNSGLFPTWSENGARNKFVRLPRVTLTIDSKQTIMIGTRVQQMARIEGFKTVEYSWMIRGKGSISIKAGDINCGIVTTSANLK